MTSDDSDAILALAKQTAEFILGQCLQFLVEDGFVSLEQVNGRWHVKTSVSDKLRGSGFAAGASIDDAGHPYVAINPNKPSLLGYVLPHEAIHLAQICKGDYEPQIGTSLWRGEIYPNLSATDPNYIQDQPWELEVSLLEEGVRQRLFAMYPDLETPDA